MSGVKCINRILAAALAASLTIGLTGCSGGEVLDRYDIYADTVSYGINGVDAADTAAFFTDDKCIPIKKNRGTKKVDSSVSEAGGLFNIDKREILYAKNINERMYPASTTKILTAYTAVKYGNLDDKITVSEKALKIDPDSSVCNLAVGDKLTLRDLLYGLMLRSGNDAAVAIAEGVGGSVEGFVSLMNQEAKALGATSSHFVTPNGLHDDNHYTTIYDMYLITQAAVSDPEVLQFMSASEYEVSYKGKDGGKKTQSWSNTCQYLNGKSTPPEGITVIGAKTGTTGAAGYCLVSYATNSSGEHLINIVYKSGSRWNLYYLMDQVFETFGNK